LTLVSRHPTSGASGWLRPFPLVLVIAALLVTAGLFVGPAPLAHAVANRYAIQGDSGKVVDAVNWGTSNGTPVQMWDFRTTGNVNNQRWDFVTRDSGYFEFVNANAPGKCLDENSSYNGAVVYLYTCTHAKNQQWHFENWGNLSQWRLRNRQDGRCLDIKDYNPNNGARLQVWDCTGAWNQGFRGLATG
jgi:hypothetical protein